MGIGHFFLLGHDGMLRITTDFWTPNDETSMSEQSGGEKVEAVTNKGHCSTSIIFMSERYDKKGLNSRMERGTRLNT